MASRNPLISIICAVRNDERFIRETLETVVAQTYPNWELIVVDGASSDKTLEILKEYAAKYKNIVLRSEPDQGQWDALTKALALAQGEYISILCGQDGYLDKDWFKRCAQVFENHPEVSLTWGIPFNMSEDGKLLGPHYVYAGFLKDDGRGSQTRPISTLVAKIDWRRPASTQRLFGLLRKLTWSRFKIILRSFWKQELPQKEDWFSYWLENHRAFPEGNMCVHKDVFLRNITRFPAETMTNSALLNFCFNFNANGYLAYGLPVAASFGRSHAEGQALRDYDEELIAKHHRQISDLKEKLKEQKMFKFVDPTGKVASQRILKI